MKKNYKFLYVKKAAVPYFRGTAAFSIYLIIQQTCDDDFQFHEGVGDAIWIFRAQSLGRTAAPSDADGILTYFAMTAAKQLNQ